MNIFEAVAELMEAGARTKGIELTGEMHILRWRCDADEDAETILESARDGHGGRRRDAAHRPEAEVADK
jgi:hypothetical protein